MKVSLIIIFIFISPFFATNFISAYPIDGFSLTGINRLLHLELIHSGQIIGKPLPTGAYKKSNEIKLQLLEDNRLKVAEITSKLDVKLQKELNKLFPNLDESYAVALLDITKGKDIRYAAKQENRGFQPGSVGKLAIVAGIFCELESIYPDSFSRRRVLLKTRKVRAGKWANTDEHTIPIYNPKNGKLIKRQVLESDVFTLFEWIDHMLSVSNNGAASIVWREAILMREFGNNYPTITDDQAEEFFTKTSKSRLSDLAISVVNDPLRELEIDENEWRLGTIFTKGARAYIPGKGGSIGTPIGLMKFLVKLEKGEIIDPDSSLEIKRLMYMTDRRIRYAANQSLSDAAVYFKSGSLYKCIAEEGYVCEKYKGNKDNFMNSVAIIEQPDGTVYLIALMSNVLKKNSNLEHNALAGRIDQLVRNSLFK